MPPCAAASCGGCSTAGEEQMASGYAHIPHSQRCTGQTVLICSSRCPQFALMQHVQLGILPGLFPGKTAIFYVWLSYTLNTLKIAGDDGRTDTLWPPSTAPRCPSAVRGHRSTARQCVRPQRRTPVTCCACSEVVSPDSVTARVVAEPVAGRTKTFCQPLFCQGFCQVLPSPRQAGLRRCLFRKLMQTVF